MRRIASAFIVTVALTTSSASAQFVDSFVDHLKNSRPSTVHSIIELDYFPSITDSKYGMPVLRFDLNFVEDGEEREVGELY